MARKYRDDGNARFKFYVQDDTNLAELLRRIVNRLASRTQVEVYLETTPAVSDQAGYIRDFIVAKLDELIRGHQLPANSLKRLTFI